MSERLEPMQCIKCGRTGGTNFQEIFNEVGVELQLESLIEQHFHVKVTYNPFEYPVLCEQCLNRLIELFDLKEQKAESVIVLTEQQAESLTGVRAPILVKRVPISTNNNDNFTEGQHILSNAVEAEDDDVTSLDDEEIFQYFDLYTEDMPEATTSANANKDVQESDDVELEIYADAVINSNLEELQLERKSTCNICYEDFTTHQSLLIHILEQHENENGSYPCVLGNCHKVLMNEGRLARHIVLKHYNISEIPIFGACRDCGMTYSNFLDFNKHSCCTTLKYGEKISNYCNICNMKFTSFKRFRFHKQFHLQQRRPRVCLLCDRFFTDSEEFFEHVHYEHEPEDRLICVRCDRAFKNKQLFETHLTTHYNEFKYKCTLCHKGYSQKNKLQNHMESYHNCGDQLKCQICNKILSNREYFRNHMQLHEPEVVVQVSSCTTCGLVGRDKVDLEVHVNSKSNCFKAHIEDEFLSIVYLCEYCDAAFKSKQDLKNHRDTGIHCDKLFHCPLCSSAFNELRKVRAHFKSHTTYDDWRKSYPLLRKYMCDVGDCEQSYTVWMSLSSHKALKHKEIKLICYKCNRQFETKADLDAHVDKCEKSRHDCQFCGKKCTSKMSLSVHIARSHNNKNVNCNECNASFKNNEILQKHIDFIHVRMECKVCHKIVKNKRNLLRHERVKHRNVKRYFCKSCNKGFYNKSDMEAHKRTVHSTTTFVCEKCPFTTNYKDSLDVHMAMHNNDLPYDCPICGRQFARKRVMYLHVRRHEVHREFVCSEYIVNGCCASFVTRYLLNKHIKEKHSTNQEIAESARKNQPCVVNDEDIDADDPENVQTDRSDQCRTYTCYNTEADQTADLAADCIVEEADESFGDDDYCIEYI